MSETKNISSYIEGLKKKNHARDVVSVVLFLVGLGVGLGMLFVLWLSDSVSKMNYDDMDPHKRTCVVGTVIQPDGTCADQERNN